MILVSQSLTEQLSAKPCSDIQKIEPDKRDSIQVRKEIPRYHSIHPFITNTLVFEVSTVLTIRYSDSLRYSSDRIYDEVGIRYLKRLM